MSEIILCFTVSMYSLGVVFCLSSPRVVVQSMMTKSFSDLSKCGITEFCFPALIWDSGDLQICLASNLFLKKEISKS